MQKIFIALSFLLSAYAYSATTVLLESESYNLKATLNAEASDLLSGSVVAEDIGCSGAYTVDLQAGQLTMMFGEENMCMMHNAKIMGVSMDNFQALLSGQTIDVTYTSMQNSMEEVPATVRVIETDIE